MSMNPSDSNYSSLFRQFFSCFPVYDSDGSNQNQGFLQNSTLNHNQFQSQYQPPLVPLQTTTENLVSSKMLNSLEPEQSLLQNFATDFYVGSETEKLLFSPSELLLNNATDQNLGGPRVPKIFSLEQLLENPVEKPLEDHVPPNQTTSEAFGKIVPEKDDYSLSFVFQEGLNYCAMINNKSTEESNNKITIKESPESGLLMEKRPSDATKPRNKGKGPLKIHDSSEKKLAKTLKRGRKINGQKSNKTKGKFEVGNSSTPGFKESSPRSKKPTLIPLTDAQLKKSDINLLESLSSSKESSASQPSITRSIEGPIRSGEQASPVKLYGELNNGSSSFDSFNWNYKNRSSGHPLYGASRLSRSSSAWDYNNRKPLPSGLTSEAEVQKWRTLLFGGRNRKGTGGKEKKTSSHTSPTLSSGTQTGTQTTTRQETNNQQLEQLQPFQEPAHQTPSKVDVTNQVQHQNFTPYFSQDWSKILMPQLNPSNFSDGQRNGHGLNHSSIYDAIPIGSSFEGMGSFKPIGFPVTVNLGDRQTKEVGAMENLGTKMNIETGNVASLKMAEKELEDMVNWPEHHLMGTDRFGFGIN